jgi:hypothetical protein
MFIFFALHLQTEAVSSFMLCLQTELVAFLYVNFGICEKHFKFSLRSIWKHIAGFPVFYTRRRLQVSLCPIYKEYL